MRIGSLFSGIGGLELGLEWAGVGRTVWQVEKDPFCRAVLARHWPEARRYDDVREVGAQNLEPVDVICGGFPCQDISYAGKGAGLAGARSGLWYEFARIVGELGPRFVVVENVAALFTRGIDAVLGTLADLGYDAEWSTLRASDVGAPHRRERVFVVAYADSRRREQRDAEKWRDAELSQRYGGREGVGDAECVRELQPEGRVAEKRGPVGDGSDELDYPDGDRTQRTGRKEQGATSGCAGVGDASGAGWQEREHATEPGHTRHLAGERWSVGVPVRGHDGTVRLIPREAAEAGPESPLWPVVAGISGRVARLRAIGNAVVPHCAEIVGRRLMEIHATMEVAA